MYAYNGIYLDDARDHLGEMFDYGINIFKMETDELWYMFAYSSVAKCLSAGDPKYIAGMSGRELFAAMIYDTQKKRIDIADSYSTKRSVEYWAGWALAYYQWVSNRTYAGICRGGITLSAVADLYILHEAPVEKFVEIINERMNSGGEENMLRRLRLYAQMTQKRLSEESGVPLRMIQLYEQGQNDITKARASTVLAISRALGCDVAELLQDM